jgi:hypothetical protein
MLIYALGMLIAALGIAATSIRQSTTHLAGFV